MKKIFIRIVIILTFILSLMFAEYRLIMRNIEPYRGQGGTVYLEVFGHVDEYYAEMME